MDVSVVIPCYAYRKAGGVARLGLVLEAFSRQAHDGFDYEIIVVDDGSEIDIAAELADRRFPVAVNVCRTEHRGMCSAYNHAIGLAGGRWLFLGLDDTVPAPGCLAAHVARHRAANSDIVVVGHEKFLHHTVLFSDPETGEPAPHTLTGVADWSWLGQAVDRLDLRDKRVTRDDVVNHFDRLDYLAANSPAYLNIYEFLTTDGAVRPALDWLAMRVGNHSLPAARLREAGGFDARLDAHDAWYMDLDLGMRLSGAGLELEYEPEARSVNLCHSKESGWGQGSFSGWAYMMSKHRSIEVAFLPQFFASMLSLSDYATLLEDVEPWWAMEERSNDDRLRQHEPRL